MGIDKQTPEGQAMDTAKHKWVGLAIQRISTQGSVSALSDIFDSVEENRRTLLAENRELKEKCAEIEVERNGDQEYLRKVMANLTLGNQRNEFIEAENQRLREALEKISLFEPDVRDEWEEAAAFKYCQSIATEALKTPQ